MMNCYTCTVAYFMHPIICVYFHGLTMCWTWNIERCYSSSCYDIWRGDLFLVIMFYELDTISKL